MNNLPVLTPGQTADLDGVAVNYTSNVKDPEDVTLILIHGFGASLESWHGVHPALSAQFPVVRLDLKGHGFSSKPKHDKYSLDEQARLVTAFINKLGLKRVVLVGHSFGGGVALLTFLQRQDRRASFDIAGLILIGSAG
ncbi:MAG: alpha/beta fold hydrolase [Betaproteobacteria bacterium]|nr:alpha/beta fold hydrolase [Betaproteobacteria bacterium]